MKNEKQTLAEYYQNLDLKKEVPPKKAFLVKVAQRCGTEVSTVMLWVMGKARPSKERYMDILSEETGIPQDQLFRV